MDDKEKDNTNDHNNTTTTEQNQKEIHSFDNNPLTRFDQGKLCLNNEEVERINKIVYDATKGSKFFLKSQKDEERIKTRVQAMQKELSKIEKEDHTALLTIIDQKIQHFENERNLNQTFLHVDMDAFYASVEIRDHPELCGKPVAVGSMSMLSTSNYEARKYGVRSAMPGFIGVKLCPSLIIVPYNFSKYKEVSRQTKLIFAEYDPYYRSFSLDEASLDITSYLQQHTTVLPQDVANQIRKQVLEITRLTCSIGISADRTLAKICSDINKPNGQFILASDRESIVNFAQNLKVRKIPGIGKVTEAILQSLGINFCRDILPNRAILWRLFSQVSAEFFFRAALGISIHNTQSETERKSLSVENTFSPSNVTVTLMNECYNLCTKLCEQLSQRDLKGKTITLKLKTDLFEVRTRSYSLGHYTNSLEDVFQVAKELLNKEMPVNLRLMGVRMSVFQNTKNLQSIDKIFESENNNNNKHENSDEDEIDNLEEEIGDFTHFENPKKRQQREKEETNKDNKKTSPNKNGDNTKTQISIKQMFENISKQKKGGVHESNDQFSVFLEERLFCPLCEKDLTEFKSFNKKINDHIDSCLNTEKKKEKAFVTLDNFFNKKEIK